MEETVSHEIAQAEVDAWLDRKRIRPTRRKDLEGAIENLVDAVKNGDLSFQEDGTIKQALLFPVGEAGEGQLGFDALEYKPRMSVLDMEKATEGISPKDISGRMNATIAALTGKARGLIKKLDTEDHRVASSIAVFFQ